MKFLKTASVLLVFVSSEAVASDLVTIPFEQYTVSLQHNSLGQCFDKDLDPALSRWEVAGFGEFKFFRNRDLCDEVGYCKTFVFTDVCKGSYYTRGDLELFDEGVLLVWGGEFESLYEAITWSPVYIQARDGGLVALQSDTSTELFELTE